MSPLTLGLTLAVSGIGGTLVVLAAFALLAGLLKRVFPLEPDVPESSDSTPLSGA